MLGLITRPTQSTGTDAGLLISLLSLLFVMFYVNLGDAPWCHGCSWLSRIQLCGLREDENTEGKILWTKRKIISVCVSENRILAFFSCVKREG